MTCYSCTGAGEAHPSIQVSVRLTASALSTKLVVKGDKAVVQALLAPGAWEIYI